MAKYSVGDKVGRLTILQTSVRSTGKSKKYYFVCECECGNVKEIRTGAIGRSTFSCGCLNKDNHKNRLGDLSRRHGMSNSKLFSIWRDMRNRCYNPKVDRYKNYGGRGVSVFQEWRESFVAFVKWALSTGYEDGLSLDRINVDGDYEPNNCRWIPKKMQGRNRTTNVMVDYYGKRICIKELSEITGINDKALYIRYQRGDRGERLWRPLRQMKSTPR